MNVIDSFFFFRVTATTEIYTLSLHDALPILVSIAISAVLVPRIAASVRAAQEEGVAAAQSRAFEIALGPRARSEEHTSELQSHSDLVCRLLLEKKKKKKSNEHKLQPASVSRH